MSDHETPMPFQHVPATGKSVPTNKTLAGLDKFDSIFLREQRLFTDESHSENHLLKYNGVEIVLGPLEARNNQQRACRPSVRAAVRTPSVDRGNASGSHHSLNSGRKPAGCQRLAVQADTSNLPVSIGRALNPAPCPPRGTLSLEGGPQMARLFPRRSPYNCTADRSAGFNRRAPNADFLDVRVSLSLDCDHHV